MKRVWMIGLAVVVVVGLLMAGLATSVSAHNADNSSATTSSGVSLDQPTLTRLAQTLGLTPGELATRLQEGETLREIAADQNIPAEEVVEAILAPYRDELQLRVKYGYITQEQADALLQEAEEHARTMLDQDLSSQVEGGGYTGGGYTWEDMARDCSSMMGSMMGGGWGGMMGSGWDMMWDMMSGGWNGVQNDWSGMGSYMGGGMMGNGWGMMSGGWNDVQNDWGGMGSHMGGGMMGMH